MVYGLRLAEALGGARARAAGLVLATFWLAPFTAVHDLAEVACQPPLLAALWLAADAEPRQRVLQHPRSPCSVDWSLGALRD